MTVSRRRFLGVSAGATAGAVMGWRTGGFLAELARDAALMDRVPGGTESFRRSVCQLCPGGCGLQVRCIEERAVKVDGNPLHPVSAGRLCPKGQAALQFLYHPDRVLTPLRRTGPRGRRSSFQAATWEEALQELGLRLQLLQRQERGHALALLLGGTQGVGNRLAAAFGQAMGSPNVVHLPRGDDGASLALWLTQGVQAVPAYDLASAEYLLSFGSAVLEGDGSPVHSMRAFGEFRQGRTGRRGKMVQVESRLSLTGAQADEWIAVNPGTEGVLALGIAGVLVAEDLYDQEFVRTRTAGFERTGGSNGDSRPGLRDLLAREFPLTRVARLTGVSVNTVMRLAREFAAARPAIAVGPRRGPTLPGRMRDHLAAHALNALVGSVDAPGGVLVPEPTPLPPLEEAPDQGAAGHGPPPLARGDDADLGPARGDPERLAASILAGSPYGIDTLMLLDVDPLAGSLAPDLYAAALEQVPLVVACTTLPTDSALSADWILPTTHFLEQWDLFTSPPGVPFPVASLARPVVPAAAGLRSAADLVLELARRVGGPVAERLPWADATARIRAEVSALYEARRGAVMGTAFDEAWVRLMERAGWWSPGYHSEEELWQRMQDDGGWWDPFYDHGNWSRVLRTASGRFEFRPEVLEPLAQQVRQPTRLAGGDDTPGRERRLSLHLFEPLVLAGGVGAEVPFLQEILDPGHEARWQTWVELHPDSAAAVGVRHRDPVRVVSPAGAVRAEVLVSPRAVPGVAAMPLGLGRRAGGRWARGVGDNPLRLVGSARERGSGLPDLESIQVRVIPEEQWTRSAAPERAG